MVLNSNQLYKLLNSFYDIPKETSKEIQSNVQSNRDHIPKVYIHLSLY
jgi:hypothetical protein